MSNPEYSLYTDKAPKTKHDARVESLRGKDLLELKWLLEQEAYKLPPAHRPATIQEIIDLADYRAIRAAITYTEIGLWPGDAVEVFDKHLADSERRFGLFVKPGYEATIGVRLVNRKTGRLHHDCDWANSYKKADLLPIAQSLL